MTDWVLTLINCSPWIILIHEVFRKYFLQHNMTCFLLWHNGPVTFTPSSLFTSVTTSKHYISHSISQLSVSTIWKFLSLPSYVNWVKRNCNILSQRRSDSENHFSLSPLIFSSLKNFLLILIWNLKTRLIVVTDQQNNSESQQWISSKYFEITFSTQQQFITVISRSVTLIKVWPLCLNASTACELWMHYLSFIVVINENNAA